MRKSPAGRSVAGRRRGLLAVALAMIAVGSVAVACMPSSALALNPERHWEKVSPAYKGGFGVGDAGIEAAGEGAVAYFSPAAFEGAPAGLTKNIDGLDYMARREPGGWVTVPVMPPDTVLPDVNDLGGGTTGAQRDLSPDLGVTMGVAPLGSSSEGAEKEGTEAKFFLHDTQAPDESADWVQAGPALSYVNRSAPLVVEYHGGGGDFCHMFFSEALVNNNTKPFGDVFLEEAENTVTPLYEQNRGCHGEPQGTHLVALDNHGDLISPSCAVDLGIEHYRGINKETMQAFNAVADEGEVVFFTTCVGGDEADHQLFVRLGGRRTLEVSRPLGEGCPGGEVPCPEAGGRASADFAGASEDGSKVFFTTTARLSGEDTDDGNDLYMAEIGCPSGRACGVSERQVNRLVAVSHDPNGGEGDVQGVVRVAPNGERVYFVAQGDLLSSSVRAGLEREGRPVPTVGADNLYVYDSVSGETKFIADLCSGSASSGAIEDRHCPVPSSVAGDSTSLELELWLNINDGGSFVQTAGAGGRYLVFTSFGQLTGDDTDMAQDVYRYDALTGQLERVSVGEDGFDSNGNNSEFNAHIMPGHFGGSVLDQHEMNDRAVSENGSRIVFVTADPLSRGATNGLVNAYEWHESPGGGGSVSLISGGNGPEPVEDVVMSASGEDVYFVAAEGLVLGDTDGETDVYDARLGAGFPSPAAVEEPCSGDACQGPLTNPAPLLIPGSVTQPAETNPADTSTASTSPTKKKAKTKGKKRKGKPRKHKSKNKHKPGVQDKRGRSVRGRGVRQGRKG